MKSKLLKLAKTLESYAESLDIISLAARYDKTNTTSVKTQNAYKYIMYLKLIRNVDDRSFHSAKRRYLNTSNNIQSECLSELDKMFLDDAKKMKISVASLRNIFRQKLKKFEYSDEFKKLNLV